MTSRRPIPAHGTEGRYKGTTTGRPPCRCPKCIRGNRHANARRALVRLQGETNLVPRDTLLAHLKSLTAAGMTQGAIARAANVSPTTISYILNGKLDGCQRSKATRILAVQPGRHDPLSPRPALPAARRIQALYAIGHGQASISSSSGLSGATIGQIAHGRYKSIDVRTDEKVRAAYRTLTRVPGTSGKARRVAASEGWVSPAAWGESIDDPAAKPDLLDEVVDLADRRELAALRRAEIEHLASFNIPEHEIADRLGMARAYVHDLIRDMRNERLTKPHLEAAA